MGCFRRVRVPTSPLCILLVFVNIYKVIILKGIELIPSRFWDYKEVWVDELEEYLEDSWILSNNQNKLLPVDRLEVS